MSNARSYHNVLQSVVRKHRGPSWLSNVDSCYNSVLANDKGPGAGSTQLRELACIEPRYKTTTSPPFDGVRGVEVKSDVDYITLLSLAVSSSCIA